MSHRTASLAPRCSHAAWALLLIGLLSASTPRRAEEPDAVSKPNIVIFLADGSTTQVSTDDKADYRYPHVEATPN